MPTAPSPAIAPRIAFAAVAQVHRRIGLNAACAPVDRVIAGVAARERRRGDEQREPQRTQIAGCTRRFRFAAEVHATRRGEQSNGACRVTARRFCRASSRGHLRLPTRRWQRVVAARSQRSPRKRRGCSAAQVCHNPSPRRGLLWNSAPAPDRTSSRFVTRGRGSRSRAAPDTGLSVEAAGRTLRVGTAPDCDLVLHDDTVSRRHCEIELTETRLSRARRAARPTACASAGVRVFDFESSARASRLALGETTLAITPLARDRGPRAGRSASASATCSAASRKMRELFAELERLAPTQLSVLIEGETGTGKELVAESIHRAEPARGRARSWCSTAARSRRRLIESELFGHERGAFTGAVGSAAGRVRRGARRHALPRRDRRAAEGPAAEAAARAGAREVKRLGARKAQSRRRARDRRDQPQLDRRGRARATSARTCTTGSRRRAFACRRCASASRTSRCWSRTSWRSKRRSLPIETIAPQVWEMFAAHRWPGNVRELRNAVQRLLVAPELALRHEDRSPPAGGRRARRRRMRSSRCASRAATRPTTSSASYLRALLERTRRQRHARRGDRRSVAPDDPEADAQARPGRVAVGAGPESALYSNETFMSRASVCRVTPSLSRMSRA